MENNTKNIERLLTVDDIAEFLQLKRKTIFNMVSAGRIPHLRINSKCVRFSRDSIIEWLKQNAEGARSEQDEEIDL